MIYELASTAVLLIHLGFVVFAVLGGLLMLKWRWAPLMHLPAVAWAAWIEWSGGVCPLTPLENHFLRLAGQAGYTGDFLQHYLLATLYPAGLTREIQMLLGAGVVTLNLVIYWMLWLRSRKPATTSMGETHSTTGKCRWMIARQSTPRGRRP